MAKAAIDLPPPPKSEVCLGPNGFRRELRARLRKPLENHRRALGRGWFTPADWSEVQRLGRLVSYMHGIRAEDEGLLYRESNKLASEIANEMFANSY